MREAKFIEGNQKYWSRLEELIDNPVGQQPGELSSLFVRVMEDLSYAQTFYPNRSVRYYLNDLAQRAYNEVKKGKPKKVKGRWIKYWTETLPLEVYHSRHYLRLAALVFFLGAFVGVISTFFDPDFPRLVLGDGYVDMSLDNMEAGDPMAVYKQGDRLEDATWITINNIFVSVIVYLAGLLLGVGGIGMLLFEGARLGAFFTLFYQNGYFGQAMLTVWQHGIIEISAIIIAGGAGLVLAGGLVFPGSYTRAKSLRISATRSLIVLSAMVPMLIFSGLVEGIFTRETEAALLVRILFLVLCIGFIILYYGVLPYVVKRKVGKYQAIEFRLPPDDDAPIDYHSIRSSGQVFKDMLSVLGKSAIIWKQFGVSIIAMLGLQGLFFYFNPNKLPDYSNSEEHINRYFGNGNEATSHANLFDQPLESWWTWLTFVPALWLLFVIAKVVNTAAEERKGAFWRFDFSTSRFIPLLISIFFGTLILGSITIARLMESYFWFLILPLSAFGMMIMAAFTYQQRKDYFPYDVGNNVAFHNLAGALNLAFLTWPICIALYFITDLMIFQPIEQFIWFHFISEDQVARFMLACMFRTLYFSIFFLGTAMMIGLGGAQLCYVNYQRISGESVMNRIEKIKVKRQWQGITRES